MRGRTHRHLDSFQIQMSGWAAIVEHHTEDLVYLAGDFRMDGFGRFFLGGDKACWALRTAAGVGNASATVFSRHW